MEENHRAELMRISIRLFEIGLELRDMMERYKPLVDGGLDNGC